jgi:hypothetical protein
MEPTTQRTQRMAYGYLGSATVPWKYNKNNYLSCNERPRY